MQLHFYIPVLLLAVLLAGCNSTSGNTRADSVFSPKTERLTRSVVAAMAAAKVPGCKTFRTVDTHVLTSTADNKKWTELWAVDTCGKKWNVPVTFRRDPRGDTYISVNIEGMVPYDTTSTSPPGPQSAAPLQKSLDHAEKENTKR